MVTKAHYKKLILFLFFFQKMAHRRRSAARKGWSGHPPSSMGGRGHVLGRLWVPHEEWRRAWWLGSACLSPDSPQSQFRYVGGNSLSCWWVQLGPTALHTLKGRQLAKWVFR